MCRFWPAQAVGSSLTGSPVRPPGRPAVASLCGARPIETFLAQYEPWLTAVLCVLFSASQGAVSLGIVTPLFLSYVIEARLKLRFLRQHYPAVCTQSGVFCQNAALDIAACAFLYVNFCVLANMLVCIVVITVTGGSL